MDDTQKRILKHYAKLNLDFLDEDELDDDAPIEEASTPREKVIGIEGVTSMPLA